MGDDYVAVVDVGYAVCSYVVVVVVVFVFDFVAADLVLLFPHAPAGDFG